MSPVLLLSPMQSISEMAPSIAAELGIDLLVETTDDDNAVEVVRRHCGVEVVVTRGGLAECVKRIENISVVEIAMSLNELLGILSKLTAQGIRRVGVVSRANLFAGAVGDFRIMDVEVCIRSRDDEQGIEEAVAELIDQGFEAIIGCRKAYATARQRGAVAVFLESGAVSIRTALLEAARILRAKEREKLQAAQLTAIIDNIEEGVVAITRDNGVSFYNELARRICTGKGQPLDFRPLTDQFLDRQGERIIAVNGNNIIARRIPLSFDEQKKGDVIAFQEVSSIQASETKIRVSSYKKGLYAKNTFDDIVAGSELMRSLIEKAKSYAHYDSNLLICGETGAGKEIFAQSIHNHSPHRNGPFVSVNTASIAPSLLESELFGYVEGAFTGARKGGKPGLFELAHRGTIFLDEIGELSPDIQSRLLRVLQEKEIMRIGDEKIIPVDVRIICATNRDLFDQVQRGSFRQDLYYRVHVLGLRIPPLRARPEDVPLLFEHYLKRIRDGAKRSIQLSGQAIELLKLYPWPGNVRQVRNVAEVIAYSGAEQVDAAQVAEVLSEQGRLGDDAGFVSISEHASLKEIEMQVIKHLVSRYPAEEVCSRLGISRVTLWRKMKNAVLENA